MQAETTSSEPIDIEYPYAFIEQLAYGVSAGGIEHTQIIRAINEVGLAVCQRLDRLIDLQESPSCQHGHWIWQSGDRWTCADCGAARRDAAPKPLPHGRRPVGQIVVDRHNDD